MTSGPAVIEVVARKDRGGLEAEGGLEQPVVVAQRAPLGLSLRPGGPAEGEDVVGIDADLIQFSGDIALRHLADLREGEDQFDGRVFRLNLSGHLPVPEAAELLHGDEGRRIGHARNEVELQEAPLHRHGGDQGARPGDGEVEHGQLPRVGELDHDDVVFTDPFGDKRLGCGVDGPVQFPVGEPFRFQADEGLLVQRIDEADLVRLRADMFLEIIDEGFVSPGPRFRPLPDHFLRC